MRIPERSCERGPHMAERYFGDYEIVRELGRGSMDVVFQARQISLNRTVALKMIATGELAIVTDVKRFYREFEKVAHLHHPGIVPIFDVGQHDGRYYVSMGSSKVRACLGDWPVGHSHLHLLDRDASKLCRTCSSCTSEGSGAIAA